VKEGFVNYPLLKKAGLEPRALERRVRDVLSSINGVADVYFSTELLDPKTPRRPYLDAYRHSLMKGRSPDFFIRDCEHCLVTDAKTGTSHGSPYSYDTRVPIVIWGSQHKPMKVNRSVRTVDIAPTLAKILNIQTPSGLDGVVLEEFGNK
jgi:predicted AlkP superfamily pyrophosphatase or phosphodiesterase